jgi:Mg-chelatase subunit ChlD
MSMTGSKLESAREAAIAFAETVNPDRDRLAVVSFSDSAQRIAGLTHDPDQVRLALSQLATSPGTRIDLGLALARNELETARRADALKAIVLLTDGRQSQETRAIEEAELAREVGTTIHVIGLGADTDAEQLRQIAGSPDNYHSAPRTQDLADLYKALAREIPCPRERFWGRR